MHESVKEGETPSAALSVVPQTPANEPLRIDILASDVNSQNPQLLQNQIQKLQIENR